MSSEQLTEYDTAVCIDQTEHTSDSSCLPQNSQNIGILPDLEEEVTLEKTTDKIEKRKKPFCELCDQSFTRAQSLIRHNTRKHPYMNYHKARQSIQAKNPKTKSKSEGESKTNQQSLEPKTRKLKIVLSADTFPAQKTVDNGRESLGRKEENISETCSSSEASVIQAMKHYCQKLEELGHQVLVVTASREHSYWFGSQYGVEFAQDNTNVIGSFFSYCKEKEDSLTNEVLMEIKQENDTAVELENNDDFVKDENYDDTAAASGDDDDDYDDGDDEAEENSDDDDGGEDNDDDNNVEKNNFLPRKHQSIQYFEKKEKFFKEIAEDFQANEKSREVSSILRKKFGVRPAIFTVEDLNRGEYNCTRCGYNFLWKCHLELHQVKNPHCGRVINFKISEEDVLKESISFENPQTGIQVTSTFQELLDSQTVHPLSCAICGKSGFKDRFRLKHHLIHHNETKTFECNICCSGFTTLRFLSTHLREHFRKSYECHRCHWRFVTALKLSQHSEGGCKTVSLINNKEGDESFETVTYKCVYCSSEVIGIKSLRKHLSEKHDKQYGPLDCILCDKKYTDTKFYNQHLLTHSKTYPCPYCHRKFNEKSSMFYHHVKSHRVSTEYPYVCDICGEKFKSKRHFDPHRRIHTGERPYVCEVEGCTKGFRSRDGLEQHKWCHKNQRFICDFCGRKFKKPSLLNNHRLTHTMDWRYPCIYCPQKFKKIRPFKKHLAKLHPTKVDEVKEKFKIVLHPCHLCQKVYFDKEDHTAHMFRHKGIKPFSCSYCGKTFNDKSNMLNHEHSHKGGKRLRCNWCSRKFMEEKYLQSHVERIHTRKHQVNDEQILEAEAEEEDMDELRESTLQIIDETIRGNAAF